MESKFEMSGISTEVEYNQAVLAYDCLYWEYFSLVDIAWVTRNLTWVYKYIYDINLERGNNRKFQSFEEFVVSAEAVVYSNHVHISFKICGVSHIFRITWGTIKKSLQRHRRYVN